MPACRIRNIFVDERRSKEAAKGPTNVQAAQIMGNSESAWDRHYDINFDVRESQAGADAMAEWRREMLQRGLLAAAERAEREDIVDIVSD